MSRQRSSLALEQKRQRLEGEHVLRMITAGSGSEPREGGVPVHAREFSRCSPKQLQAKLDLPRGCCRAGDGARGARNSRGREHDEIRRIEIRVIQEVKELRAKFEIATLGDRRPLQERKIPGGQPWTDERVPAEIALKAAVGRRLQECSRVEPLVWISQNDWSGEIWIGKRANGVTCVEVIRRVVAELWRKRKAALHGHNAVHGPAPRQFAADPLQSAPVRLPGPERQFVRGAGLVKRVTIIKSLRVTVKPAESQTVAETAIQLDLQGVVGAGAE